MATSGKSPGIRIFRLDNHQTISNPYHATIAPMDKNVILALIKDAVKYKSELSNVELKDARGGLPRDIWQAISAFSQKPGGGIIVFGLFEDRKNKIIQIVGIQDLATLQEKISNLVADHMSMIIRPDYHIITFHKKTLLAVTVAECPDQFKPCYYKPVGLPNGAYIRDGNTNRKITDTEMRMFIEHAQQLKFDKYPAEEISLEDIDKKNKITSGETRRIYRPY